MRHLTTNIMCLVVGLYWRRTKFLRQPPLFFDSGGREAPGRQGWETRCPA